LDLLEKAILNKKKEAPFYYKFFSLFSVVRGYNLIIVFIAQLLSALFVFAPNKLLQQVVFDYKLWVLMLASSTVIAAGYIINHFYDQGKDAINRPLKTQIDTYISQKTKLKSYFLLNFIGFGLGFLVSWRAALFFGVYIFLIWFYSHKLKRYPLTGLFGAAFLSILPFFAVFAYYKNFTEIIFIHASFLFFLLMVKELIKDLENLKGDMLYNYQTIVTHYGEYFTRLLISVVILLSLVPVYFIVQYPEVGLMKYYFAFAVFGLTLIAVLIWFSKSNAQYVFLHNVIKIIILVGVFSLMFIDTSVIIDRIISEL
jgi:4-hydroxybenzoate polyprenyltransferase